MKRKPNLVEYFDADDKISKREFIRIQKGSYTMNVNVAIRNKILTRKEFNSLKEKKLITTSNIGGREFIDPAELASAVKYLIKKG